MKHLRLKASQTAWWVVWAVILFVEASPAWAVILLSSAERNTAAPEGDLAGSGWQYQGQWRDFLGTPISPRHFTTAKHIGGSIGAKFLYQGQEFTTVARWDDPDSDLRIWEVSQEFDTFAPLYSSDDEVGRGFVVFGRGTQRGGEVVVDGQVKGWRWGADDNVQSWGQNTVSGVGGDVDELLEFTFDAGAGPNESQLSGGDSGGGVFINDGGVWKLAGVNLGVSGPYRLTQGGEKFEAAIFDQGGLFVATESGAFELVEDTAADRPGTSVATRISARLQWIESVIVPEPSVGLVVCAGMTAAALMRRKKS